MLSITRLAENVARDVAGEVSFVPDYKIRDVQSTRTVVVPFGVEKKAISRGQMETRLKIQIGLLKKCIEDEIPQLVDQLMHIGENFLWRSILGAVCIKTEYVPLYSPEHFREKRQFTGVVELTFQLVENGYSNRI